MSKPLGRLTVSDIELTLELSRVRSIRELARRVGLLPSQVSRAVAKVERAFGERLLERSVNGVVPTARGRQVMERFLTIERELQEARREHGAREVELSIGASAFLNTRLVAPAICAVGKALSPDQCRLLDVAPDDLVQSGIRGAFVASVHMGALDWPRTWTSKRIGKLVWRLYARSGHRLAKQKQLKEAHLQEIPFVYPMYWTPTGFAFGNDQCPLKREQRSQGTATATADAALAVMQNSDQLAFLPDIVARDAMTTRRAVQLTVKEWRSVERPVHLSVRSDAVTKSLFEEFAQKLAVVLAG